MDISQTLKEVTISVADLGPIIAGLGSFIIGILGIIYGLFKWFLGRLDKKEEERDKFFEKISDAIQELKVSNIELRLLNSYHERDIEALKNVVYKVKYEGKNDT